MTSPWIFVDDIPPAVDGWYAVTICYDPHEGMFPDAEDSLGGTFERSNVLAYFGPFESKQEAIDAAYENDMEP